MYIKSVRLRNYRNYENQIIQFDKGMNIIIGDNGEGKTNLLEAIYLLSTTRSHRIDENRELIRFENEFGTVEGNIVSDDHASKMSVVVHKKGKTLMIDNNVIRRNSEFIGKINAVLFAPDDMNLFDDSPRTRRRLFDMEIGKLYPVYMYSLTNYLKYLKERNNYLKGNVDSIMLETLTELLYDPQIEIIRERNKFINSVNEYISNYYNQISGENHQLRIEYKSVISEKNDETVMKQQLKDLYSNLLDRDIYLKQTNSGIHREDYVFYLDDKDVSLYCSQGQKRTVILALKLAIVQIIFDIKKEYPVLLLDDVFSELDSNRRYNILKLLPASVQTIITTTDAREAEFIKDKNVYFINIKKGMMENAY
ncbi:MAG: DNA replication/repair protein RecF [Erysipelotrichaceae bacterium]|nr:DNA replication/repair protein RecF [Erysipelotrichaceae bacterium]